MIITSCTLLLLLWFLLLLLLLLLLLPLLLLPLLLLPLAVRLLGVRLLGVRCWRQSANGCLCAQPPRGSVCGAGAAGPRQFWCCSGPAQQLELQEVWLGARLKIDTAHNSLARLQVPCKTRQHSSSVDSNSISTRGAGRGCLWLPMQAAALT